MVALKITVLLGLCSGAFVLVTSQNDQAAEYGQNCTDVRCFSKDILDPLFCDPTKKICRCPNDMFRHPELNRCVSPHGKPCTLQTGNGSAIKTCTDFAQCWVNNTVKAAVLAEEIEGLCHCDLDATHDDKITGRCKLTHGSKRCEQKETRCDTSASLTCVEGECVCLNQEHQMYDESKKACLTLAGGSCAQQLPFPKPSCGANMNCNATSNICECLNGFEQTESGTCGKKYNGTCTADSECHSQFFCDPTDKMCRCRAGQEYHQNQQVCRILVGESCIANATDFQCTSNATCLQGTCSCDEGYKNDANKKCIGLFGSACDGEEDIKCATEDFLECNTNKICQCKANYQEDAKKCKGFIHQQCRNTNDDCITNSICLSGICACGEKQVPGEDNRACFGVLEGPCSETTACSQKHHLVCTNSVCGCTNVTLANPTTSGCVAKAGTSCGALPDDIKCAGNATCSSEFLCNCNTGLKQNENGVCINADNGGSSLTFGSGPLIAFLMSGVLMMRKF